jgi:hypothetical protein
MAMCGPASSQQPAGKFNTEQTKSGMLEQQYSNDVYAVLLGRPASVRFHNA